MLTVQRTVKSNRKDSIATLPPPLPTVATAIAISCEVPEQAVPPSDEISPNDNFEETEATESGDLEVDYEQGRGHHAPFCGQGISCLL